MCWTADLWCTVRWEELPWVEIPSCQPFTHTRAEGMNSWCKPIKYVCVLQGEKWSREAGDAKWAIRSHHHTPAGCMSWICFLGDTSTCVSGECLQIGKIKRQWRNNPLVGYYTAAISKGQAVSAVCTHTPHTRFSSAHITYMTRIFTYAETDLLYTY